MRTAKFIAVTALFTALLIAAQFALSGVAGVELVTVLLLSFSFATGIRYGVTGAACFSLLRCFLFGFYPTVIILYLIYYPSFALFFGFLGNKSKRKITPALFVAVVIFAAAFTACFSLLDDVITLYSRRYVTIQALTLPPRKVRPSTPPPMVRSRAKSLGPATASAWC